MRRAWQAPNGGHGGREIVEQVLESLALWTPTALDAGLGREWTRALEGEFVRFG